MNIEAGWYSFRAVVVDREDETAVMQSYPKYASDGADLRQNRKDYIEYLTTLCGMKSVRITHTIREKGPNYSYFSM